MPRSRQLAAGGNHSLIYGKPSTRLHPQERERILTYISSATLSTHKKADFENKMMYATDNGTTIVENKSTTHLSPALVSAAVHVSLMDPLASHTRHKRVHHIPI